MHDEEKREHRYRRHKLDGRSLVPPLPLGMPNPDWQAPHVYCHPTHHLGEHLWRGKADNSAAKVTYFLFKWAKACCVYNG